MKILPTEPMNYKQSLKSEATELLTKCRIIRYRLKEKITESKIAEAFKMSRNSVGNIIRIFKKKIPPDHQKIILEESVQQEELLILLEPLKNKKRKPKTNKRSASKEQENLVLNLYKEKKMSYGYKRFWQTLQIILERDPPKELEALKSITYAQIRGIYKRNKLRVKKIRTQNKSRRPLYDYSQISCFEYLHIDTKEIVDQKALPPEIYEKFKLNPDLPIYELNVVEAKSRFRFISYTHKCASYLSFHYLLFVVAFLRTHDFISPEIPIKIGMDNGTEFCRGSKKKEAEWNQTFNRLNAEIYTYNPHFDVRKNLIERTHLSDDQEFFVPRSFAMNDELSFLLEASQYNYFWNFVRPHSGIKMNGLTPFEKLKKSGVSFPERLFLFPTFILDKHIDFIRQTTDFLRFEDAFFDIDLSSQKLFADLKYKFKNNFFAQNVLTQYLSKVIID